MEFSSSEAAATIVPRFGILVDTIGIVAGAGLIAAAAQISIPLPFTPVPITGQTFGVFLVAGGLGPIRGTSSVTLYVLLGLVGAPVYAAGAHGFEVLTGPTGGYLIGFPIAAALVGWFAERRRYSGIASMVGVMLSGTVLIYTVGIPWLAVSLHTNIHNALEDGLYPFVAGDVLKLYIASSILGTAWRVRGGVLRS